MYHPTRSDPHRRLILLSATTFLAAAVAGCASPPPVRPTPRPAPVPPPAPPQPPAPAPGAVTSPVPSSSIPAPSPMAPAAPAAPAPSTPGPRGPSLPDELARLRNELAGTPVVVELTAAGLLRVEVPARFCFDAGKAVVKPPLAAVLDRMMTGLRRQTGTQLRIAAPTDAGDQQLANERAASVRDYFVARGLPPARVTSIGRGDRPGVEVTVADPGA